MSAYFALKNIYRSKEMGKFVQWLLRVMEYILHCGISTFKNLSICFLVFKTAFIPFTFDD